MPRVVVPRELSDLPTDLAYRDEEFRERVIRQAMLLGFSAEEYTIAGVSTIWVRWQFWHERDPYTGYISCFTAAVDYMRLIGFPMEKLGVIDG